MIELAGAALCSEHVEQLILGIPSLGGGSIARVAGLMTRIHMRRDVHTGTLWRVVAVGL